MAADSAASDVTTGLKQPVDKIFRIGDHAILCGGSGDGGLLQNIETSLIDGLVGWPDLRGKCRQIQHLIVDELRETIGTHVPYPEGGFQAPPAAIMLSAGMHDGKPWILEVERNGGATLFDERLGNFAAIGSGKPWAEAIFRPHLKRDRDLKLGRIFAYRILKDSIDLAAAGLAEPIRMFTVSKDNEVAQVSAGELKGLEETCDTWRELEGETVGALLAPGIAEESDTRIPDPE